jgi:hypothetical protein
MRDPRPGIGWSTRRLSTRAAYRHYMTGSVWSQRRRLSLTTWYDRYHHQPVCQLCAKPWTLTAGDLHHRSCRHLGHEPDRDLIPLRRRCHTALHVLSETSAWRRLGRPQGADALVAVLRRQNRPRS